MKNPRRSCGYNESWSLSIDNQRRSCPASIATTTAAAVGAFSVANSAIKHTISGFAKLKEGLRKNSPSQVFEGILDLRKAYNTTEDLLSDFESYIDQTENDFSVREAYKQGIKEFKSYIQAEIEDTCVSLLYEVEDFLKRKHTTLQEYNNKIFTIYHSNFYGCNKESYLYILGQAGKVYNEIVCINLCLGLWSDFYRYDHYLAYCIAGWIKDNLSNKTADIKTQREVAADITNNIFKYIKGEKL